METFLEKLRSAGYKITPQRRAVWEALQTQAAFPTAHQILDVVRRTQPDVSLDTIYRNLALLTDLGLVHEIFRPAGSVYELTRPGHHHHHLVCTACGRTECIDVCPMTPIYDAEAAKKGFRITGHIFEFYGLCRKCQVKNRK